jgi:hypothetical protein
MRFTKRTCKDLSEIQRRCLIEATIDDLRPFPRGYARTKSGPTFYPRATVQNLIRRGALRKLNRMHHLSARAANA